MEPVTHLLTGACLSRTGLNRRAAYATLTMVVAAELPDIDTLWGLRGPIEGFQHHRGITHTFLGLPFEAALIVAAVYGWHRWRVWRANVGRGDEVWAAGGNRGVLPLRYAQGQDDGVKQASASANATTNTGVSPLRPAAFGRDDEGWAGVGRKGTDETVVRPLTAAPVRWGVLYGLALVALLSHLLLDYTNNYGLRPFFPFDDRWYAASIVFIFDPVMFVLLLIALVAPWLFGLVSSEVGARKQPFQGRGWAIAALLGVVGWWTLREVEHARAVQLAMDQSIAALPVVVDQPSTPNGAAPVDAASTYVSAQRVLASPEPLSPFHWSAATDFGPLYQLSEIDTWNGSLTTGDTTYPKQGRSSAVLKTEESMLGRVYMDWSPMPIVTVTRPDSDLASAEGEVAGANTVVTFRDPRFMGGWMREAGRSALVGTVELNAAGDVVRETMDGRAEW